MFITVFLVLFFLVLAESEKFDVIVIGSGISGMSAASLLSQNGKNVVLLEQGENIGGSIQSFTRTGKSGLEYTFEPGMHILDGDGSDFSSISGEKIKMTPFGEVVDILYFGDSQTEGLSLPPGLEPMFGALIEHFPSEKDKIEFFINTVKTIRNVSFSLSDLFDEIKPSDELRFALSYMKDYTSFDDFPVLVYGHLLDFAFAKSRGGAAFPVGSTKRIIEGVMTQILKGKSQKSKIYNSCEAKKLLLDDQQKVTGVSASCGDFEAEYVISTMGGRNTFDPSFIERDVLEKYGYLEKAESLKTGISGMIHFLGFNISNKILGLPTANVWVENIDGEEDDEFTPNRIFSSCLSCRDPSYPSDRTDFFILNIIDYSLFSQWEDSYTHERPSDYYQYKQKFEDAAMKWLYHTFPNTRTYEPDIIVTSTPLTIRDYLNHKNGTIYGAELGMQDMGWLTTKTQIGGLYLAGQDTGGGGVQGGIGTGTAACHAVLGDMKK